MTEIILIAAVICVGWLLIRSQKQNKQQAQQNRAAGREFLQQNGQNPDVTTTSSGLQYQIIQPGSGTEHPSASAKVQVHYHGTLIDGRVFDSSVDRGEPISFGLNQVIKGWTEGVQLMVVGEKRRLFIPADLAYGDGSAGIITPGSTLIFEVELLAINP
jgi:peptidylprolyl isomerase